MTTTSWSRSAPAQPAAGKQQPSDLAAAYTAAAQHAANYKAAAAAPQAAGAAAGPPSAARTHWGPRGPAAGAEADEQRTLTAAEQLRAHCWGPREGAPAPAAAAAEEQRPLSAAEQLRAHCWGSASGARPRGRHGGIALADATPPTPAPSPASPWGLDPTADCWSPPPDAQQGGSRNASPTPVLSAAAEQLRAHCWSAPHTGRPRGGYAGWGRPQPRRSQVSVWKASEAALSPLGNPHVVPDAPPGQQQQFAGGAAEFAQRREELMRAAPETLAEVDRSIREIAAAGLRRDAERLDVAAALRTVDENQVTFISSDTGTGKSSLIPSGIVDQARSRGAEVHVCSAQPRRTAALRLAQRVAGLRGQQPGRGDVGHWVRGRRAGGEHTKLWYMTSYTLLLQLLEFPLSPPFTHIVIDEFHERPPDVEVTVGLLRLALHRGARFKLVLMSATQDAAAWQEYFTGLSVGVYSGGGCAFPVRTFDLADCVRLSGIPLVPAERFVPGLVAPAAVESLVGLAQGVIACLAELGDPGQSILVFVPGHAQVGQLASWARGPLGHRLFPVPWHSSVDLGVIQRAIAADPPPGLRKVYLATDIAEVSVTVPDAAIVVDLCLVKRPAIDTDSAPASALFPPLALQWASQASAAQRRGRVGRTRPGLYFSLLTAEQAAALPLYAAPPIASTCIDGLLLAMLRICSAPGALCSLLRTSPHPVALAAAVTAITDRGGATTGGDATGGGWGEAIIAAAAEASEGTYPRLQVTGKGAVLQRLPLSLRAADCAWHGLLLPPPLPELMALAAAVADSPSVFVHRAIDGDLGGSPGADASACDRAEEQMAGRAGELRSDIVAGMDAVLEWGAERAEPGAEWYQERSLAPQRLRQAKEAWSHVRQELCTLLPDAFAADAPDPQQLRTQLVDSRRLVAVLVAAGYADHAATVVGVGGAGTEERNAAAALCSAAAHFLPRGARVLSQDAHVAGGADWHEGQCAVPCSISLRPGAACAAVASHAGAVFSHAAEYWTLCCAFANTLRHLPMEDEEGQYSVFAVTFNKRLQLLQCDSEHAAAVLELRRSIARIAAAVEARVGRPGGTEQRGRVEWLGAELAAAQRSAQVSLLLDLLASDSEALLYEATDEAAAEWADREAAAETLRHI